MTRFIFAAFAVLLLIAAPAVEAATSSPALDLARQLNSAFVEVAEQASRSVVVIRVAQRTTASPLDDEDNPFWDEVPKEFRERYEQERSERDKQRKESDDDEKPSAPPNFNGQGSGVIIRDDGYILTNFHVVENAERIQVRLLDGRRFVGTLRGKDPQSDLAVIKIAETNLPAAKLGDSEKLRVGEFAIAIGAPFELDYSVTFGHVSAKGRSHVVPSIGFNSQGAKMDQDFIQTDASINPGNSGGPLVNLYGEVIGINTLIRGLHTGIGFAVPVNLARQVSNKLISDGKFERLWLGVGIRGLREGEDEPEKIPGVEDGVLVTVISPGGPASKSELKRGDVVVSVDGRKVSTAAQLRNEVRGKTLGTAVTLEVVRASKPLQVQVHPETWPDPPDEKPKSKGRSKSEDGTP